MNESSSTEDLSVEEPCLLAERSRYEIDGAVDPHKRFEVCYYEVVYLAKIYVKYLLNALRQCRNPELSSQDFSDCLAMCHDRLFSLKEHIGREGFAEITTGLYEETERFLKGPMAEEMALLEWEIATVRKLKDSWENLE